ncbi:MAG: efflux RND transporter permease subunit [Pseudomonadales bacterium]
MQQWKIAIEAAFGRFGHFAFRRSWYVIIAIALFYCALIAQLPKLTSDTSIEGFLRADDPVLLNYNHFREQFGRDELIIVAIESTEIFTVEFLQTLQTLHAELETSVPYLDKIDSLVNARHIYGDVDELIVEDLLETLPQTSAQLSALRNQVEGHPLYVNSLLSKDATVTTLLLKLNAKYKVGNVGDTPQWRYLGDEQMQEAAAEVATVLERYQPQFISVHMAGSPAFIAAVNKEMKYNTLLFAALTIVIIVLVLGLLFRRASGVVLPMLLAFMSLTSTFSSLPLFDAPFQLPMTILPSFVLATGVGTAIHVLAIFYRNFDCSGDKRDAMSKALSNTGLAVLFTSATTAAGLSSFVGGDLVPIANLGLFAAVSMLFTFCYTIFLLPALVAVLPLKMRRPQQRAGAVLVDRFTTACAAIAIRFPLPIVLASFLLLTLGLVSAAQLNFSHDMKQWFNPEHPIIISTNFIEKHMGGTAPVEIIVEVRGEQAMQAPALLGKLEQLQDELAAYDDGDVRVGKVLGVAQIIKETNQALHGNDAQYYRIPQRRDLAAQEFFLLELSGADDLFQLVDTEYEVARTTAMLPLVDAFYYADFMRDTEARYRAVLGKDAVVYITGMTPLLNKTMGELVGTTARSYAIAMLVITLMMVILLGSFKFGLLSMLPNVLPVVIALGLMNVFSAPLDMYSMTIGAIAIGLSVDDTVHFMHSFRRLMYETGDVAESIRETLASTGKALTITTIVISLSFFNYMFSDMTNLFNFGFYTGICIVLALLADLLFAPALMMLVHQKRGQPIH